MISSSLPPYLASKPGQIFSEGIQIKHPKPVDGCTWFCYYRA
jgi:hypothetical protein